MNAAAIVMAVLAAAAPVEGAGPAPAKAPITVEAPKLDLKLAPLPLLEGLSGPSRENDLQARDAPSDQRTPANLEGAKIASVTHAKSFSQAEGRHRPVSPIESFEVGSFPARIAPFKTCIRLTSGERLPVVVRVALRSPNGDDLLSSRSEVSFGARDSMELVVDWDGFQALRAGNYKLLVSLDGGLPAEYPLSVQQAK